MASEGANMDLLHQQLLIRAQLTQMRTQYSPIPDSTTPGPESEVKIAVFLRLIHEIHSILRYSFRAIEMKAPTLWDEDQIVPNKTRLFPIFARLATSLLKPSLVSKFELGYLKPLADPSTLVTVLLLVYNAYLHYPPNYRARSSRPLAAATADGVLGWQKSTRSSLPLAEAALLFQVRTNGYLKATQAHWWQSRILNAITVAPSQGQLEWLALVADTLVDERNITGISDLEWYNVVDSECSRSFEGSESLVVNEILMTDATIERPNELMNIVTGPVLAVPGKITDLIYAARLHFCKQRQRPNIPRSLQPAPAARAMIKHIEAALWCKLPENRSELYEKWIGSEWDAPAILFSLTKIRNIIEHLDNSFSGQYITDQVLRALIVAERGLKGVCARVRSLVRSITKDLVLPSLVKPKSPLSPQVVDAIALAVEASAISLQPSHLDTVRGLTFDGLRMIGTNVEQLKKPRRVWDMMFNVVIESWYTQLPWMAISHSWAQADGSCFTYINGRANVIPWATLMDLRNIRSAVLQAGYTIGWMDKICLRQRGTDGFDSALRQIEWVTDIPFLDIAYSQAGKILVYLDGAGRYLRYRSTFREGVAWLFRKWTAQETPSSVDIVIGSGSCCLEGDFFSQCETIVEEWHRRNHRKSADDASCAACDSIRLRIKAIQDFRDLSEDAEAADRAQAVWSLIRGRTAGCAADDVFSLLSILGIRRRPPYDPRYTREQASSLVKETISNKMLMVLEDREHCTWFDGMFQPRWNIQTVSRHVGTQLGPFNPYQVQAPEEYRENIYRLTGVISPRQRVKINRNSKIFDSTGRATSARCACIQMANPLLLSSRIIHQDCFEWHGSEACCGSFWDVDPSYLDESALEAADHLLLSENRLVCILLRAQEKNRVKIYTIIPSGEMVAVSTAPQWVILARGVKSTNALVELPDIELSNTPIWV